MSEVVDKQQKKVKPAQHQGNEQLPPKPPSQQQQQRNRAQALISTQQPSQQKTSQIISGHRLALFDHLSRKQHEENPFSIEGDRNLHPSTLRLGLLLRNGLIREDDDRAAALLACFCNIIDSFNTPTNKRLSAELDRHIKLQVQHLVECRQLCIGMGNIIKYLRSAVAKIPPDMSESDAKKSLVSLLHSFLEERVVYARENITELCCSAFRDDDVILTFGTSPLLRQVLLGATAAHKGMRVVVVDTRPLNDGLVTLETLTAAGVQCQYTLLSGCASVIKTATKCVLGASALMSNGAMLAAAGSAMVAALAKAAGVPVIVLCESFKFSEKVQLDSIVYNELGSVCEVVKLAEAGGEDCEEASDQDKDSSNSKCVVVQRHAVYSGAADMSTSTTSVPHAPSSGAPSSDHTVSKEAQLAASMGFQVLNLRYDLTPMLNISAVATESGVIPPTSVPVLIRELRSDVGANTEQDN